MVWYDVTGGLDTGLPVMVEVWWDPFARREKVLMVHHIGPFDSDMDYLDERLAAYHAADALVKRMRACKLAMIAAERAGVDAVRELARQLLQE